MNFQDVNAHVEGLDLSAFQPQVNAKTVGTTQPQHSALLTQEPIQVLSKVCEVYQKVRPVLLFVANFWLIPVKWRQAVTVLVSTLDGICPQQ